MSGSPIPMADLAGMQAWAEELMASRPCDFPIGGDVDPYILRWWVIPRNPWSNQYLHDIRRSDDDRALHDHPWPNTSFLIFGSYIEHTPEGSFVRKAGDVIFRPASAFHRLEVIPGQRAISLFTTGPKVREWGFACPQGWVHWQDFTSEDGKFVGRGCGEHDGLTPTTEIGQPRGTSPLPLPEKAA
jgi:hypothetical protein